MDGLSAAASIIAIVQIAGSVASLGYSYVASVKRAPKELRELLKELGSLSDVLDTLQDYVAANPQSPALEKLNISGGPLKGCATELNGLHAKLSSIKLTRGASGAVERFIKWPFLEREMAQFIEKIERHKNLFTFALTVDHISLSKKIEAYVSNTDLIVQDIRADFQDTTLTVHEIKANVRDTVFVVQDLKKGVQDTRITVCEIKADQTAQKRNATLNWVHPDDFDKKHLEISERRQEHTGEWFLRSPEFQELLKKNPTSRLLWAYGIPGAGKTFISSTVIDYLQREASLTPDNYGVAYFYFNFTDQDQQRPAYVLASLVKQLAGQAAELPSTIKELYEKLEPKQQRPKPEELYLALLATIKSFGQVFIVLDALDECSRQHRNGLLPLFHQMERDGINLFLTSRHHPEDIQNSFCNSAKVEIRAKDDDLETYIRYKINKNTRAKNLIARGRCEEKIISELLDCANGMFLLVHFHIEYICQQTTPRKILRELERLRISTTEEGHLDATYSRAMESIQRQAKDSVELAKKVFSWLVKAKRTLTVDELQMAVSVEPDLYELDDMDLPDRATLLDVCAGLVAIDVNSNTIRLAHYTVQEYLLKRSEILNDADFSLAMACTTFLSFDVFAQGPCTSDYYLEDRNATYSFLSYAAYYLADHIKSCDEILSTELLLRFLGNPGNIYSYLQVLDHYTRIAEGYLGRYDGYAKQESPLHVASGIGHELAVRLLLEKGAEVSARNSKGQTALHRAARGGHEPVVRLLLRKGVNINDQTGLEFRQMTALHIAVEQRHEAVVRLLLENGANVSARAGHLWDGSQETALHIAARSGCEAIVRVLLENGANTSLFSSWGTALHNAARSGCEAVVRMLLENGADVSAQTNPLWHRPRETALHIAAKSGCEAVVRVLLENGADVSARTSLLWERPQETALHIAAKSGCEAVVRVLLENGADVSARTSPLWDGPQETALHIAARSGCEAVVRVLLENGANVSERISDSGDGTQETSLHIVARDGSYEMAQLLLDHGADIGARTHSPGVGGQGKTALDYAMEKRRNIEVVRLLGGRSAYHY